MRKVSRREFVAAAGFTGVGFALGFGAKSIAPMPSGSVEVPLSNPGEALRLLLDGNKRYAAGSPLHPNQSKSRRLEVAGGQAPWAIILGCVDSRVPPEMVFDRGLGDMFVARTAGQVIDNAVLGSLEFGVEEGAKLIMVLGHQNCGAVKATIQTMQGNGHAEEHIDFLVQATKPAVENARLHPGDLMDNTVRANVLLQVDSLKSSSSIISHAVESSSVGLVGARYDLGTGLVEIIT